jgi:hypothetical protein
MYLQALHNAYRNPSAFKLDFYERLLNVNQMNYVLFVVCAFDKASLFETPTAILDLTYTFVNVATCFDT